MHTLGHNDGPAVEDERRENTEREKEMRGESCFFGVPVRKCLRCESGGLGGHGGGVFIRALPRQEESTQNQLRTSNLLFFHQYVDFRGTIFKIDRNCIS